MISVHISVLISILLSSVEKPRELYDHFICESVAGCRHAHSTQVPLQRSILTIHNKLWMRCLKPKMKLSCELKSNASNRLSQENPVHFYNVAIFEYIQKLLLSVRKIEKWKENVKPNEYRLAFFFDKHSLPLKFDNRIHLWLWLDFESKTPLMLDIHSITRTCFRAAENWHFFHLGLFVSKTIWNGVMIINWANNSSLLFLKWGTFMMNVSHPRL